jgi:hypothetical protein
VGCLRTFNAGLKKLRIILKKVQRDMSKPQPFQPYHSWANMSW